MILYIITIVAILLFFISYQNLSVSTENFVNKKEEDASQEAAQELYRMEQIELQNALGPKVNQSQHKLMEAGILKKNFWGWSEPRISNNLSKAKECNTLVGNMTGFQPNWYGLFGEQKPCQVVKIPGVWFDKDGWYARYYNIFSKKFETKHLMSSPNLYNKPYKISVLNSLLGDKEYS